MKTIHPIPFLFDQLPRFSAEEAELISRLALLDFGPMCQAGEQALLHVAKKYFSQHFRVSRVRVSPIRSDVIRTRIKTHVWTSMTLPEHACSLLAAISVPTAQTWVDRLLGGTGVTTSRTSLSELEEGTYEFFILKVLDQLNAPHREPPYHLQYNGLLHELDIERLLKAEADQHFPFVEVQLTFETPTPIDVFLYMPRAQVDTLYREAVTQGLLSERRLLCLHGHDTTLSLEVGSLALTPEEWRTLELGDIVLFEDTEAMLLEPSQENAPNALEGRLRLRSDLLKDAYFKADLSESVDSNSESRYSAKKRYVMTLDDWTEDRRDV